MHFDPTTPSGDNFFIKHSPNMLQGIFGSTDIAPFWVADMDFKVAQPISDELQRLVNRGQYAYEFASEEIYQAISNWFATRHKLTLQPSQFIQVSGVLTGIGLLIRELSEPSQGVLINTPAYHQFSKVISANDREVINSPLTIVDGQYQIDFTDLETKMSQPNVGLMILCNPHNPTGRVWTKQELQQLAALADKHNVTIISDEIHADITYAPHTFTSLMGIAAKNHVALIGSPSKTFGMQSISNGYIYTENEAIYKAMQHKVDALYLGHGNAFTTFATIAAYQDGGPWLDGMLDYLQGTISALANCIASELPEVKMFEVQGTYQLWLDFSATGITDKDLLALLSKAKFGASPGTWFDANGGQYIRVNLASPREQILAAFRRLKTAMLSFTPTPSCTTSSQNGGGCC